jgi:hypothetical protein
MPANTPRGYTYPVYGDVNNFPAQIQDFATDVDTDVQAIVTAATTALTAAPSARVSAVANQAIAANVNVTVTWATEEFDNAAMANLGVSNTILTFTSLGDYLLHADVNFTPNGNATVNGRSGAFVFTGGVIGTAPNRVRGAQSMDVEWAVTTLARVTSLPSTVAVQVRQESGAALNITARSFSATKVRI